MCMVALVLIGVRAVIGAYGPVDGLVLGHLMITTFTALAYRLGLMQ